MSAPIEVVRQFRWVCDECHDCGPLYPEPMHSAIRGGWAVHRRNCRALYEARRPAPIPEGSVD